MTYTCIYLFHVSCYCCTIKIGTTLTFYVCSFKQLWRLFKEFIMIYDMNALQISTLRYVLQKSLFALPVAWSSGQHIMQLAPNVKANSPACGSSYLMCNSDLVSLLVSSHHLSNPGDVIVFPPIFHFAILVLIRSWATIKFWLRVSPRLLRPYYWH